MPHTSERDPTAAAPPPLQLIRTFSPVLGSASPSLNLPLPRSKPLMDRAVFSVLSPPPPNLYVAGRRGGVLTRGMVLKSDHFASGHTKLDIHVSGAPNFRQVRATNLYGVGQPTVSGYDCHYRPRAAAAYSMKRGSSFVMCRMRTVLNLMKSHARARTRARMQQNHRASPAPSHPAPHAHGHSLNIFPHSRTPPLPSSSSTASAPAGAAATSSHPPHHPPAAHTPPLPSSTTTAAPDAAPHSHHPQPRLSLTLQHSNRTSITAATNNTATAHAAAAPHPNQSAGAAHNHSHARSGMPTVHWTNLREEAVIYLNNRPFVLRSVSACFTCM
jgi:hypothetical protein